MKKYSTRKLIINGLMIALVFLATYFTRIPTPLPGGYFNLGDALIMLASVFMGPATGMLTGAIGSAFADLAAGALLFAPITFIVKGLEGLVTGLLSMKYRESAVVRLEISTGGKRGSEEQRPNGIKGKGVIAAIAAGAVIMIAGYFAAEAFILGYFDHTFGFAAAVSEVLPNVIQGGLSAILGYVLIMLLSKVDAWEFIR